MEKIEQIKQLFDSLTDNDKYLVLDFILKDTRPKDTNRFKGIFVGPAPSLEDMICDECGSPFRKKSKD